MKSLLKSSLLVIAASLALLALPGLAAAQTPLITTGTDHACAVNDVGKAFCWGANEKGQLGDGDTFESFTPKPVVGLPAAVVSINSGQKTTCALLGDGTVWCWGVNGEGELASGGTDTLAHPNPVKIASLSGVTQLSGGMTTYCALLADATARCWGANGYSEIGNGTASSSVNTPTSPTGLSGVRNIAAGYTHTCAILLDGTGKCWGYNAGGILGDGTTNPRISPVTVVGLANAVSARLSGYSSCAILKAGTVQCWGAPSFLGNDAVSSSPTPVDVKNLTSVASLGGSNNNNCAISMPNRLKCWGSIPGVGFTTVAGTPVDVVNGGDALAVSTNAFNGNVCLGARGGAARCWGTNNDSGQLGSGGTSTGEVLAPQPVVNLDLVTQSYASPSVTLVRAGKTSVDKKKKTYSQLAVLTAALPDLLGQLDGCTGSATGTVSYSYKTVKKVHGKKKTKTVKKTAKSSATFNGAGWTCVSNITYKLPVKYLNHKKVTLKATWPGNGALNAFAASAAKFTLPKVKVKKRK